ncbi:MAG: arylsulfatase A-like enzyme [Planctomycetota bacterium]|jgi:arylsulfatase A-like enzyme
MELASIRALRRGTALVCGIAFIAFGCRDKVQPHAGTSANWRASYETAAVEQAATRLTARQTAADSEPLGWGMDATQVSRLAASESTAERLLLEGSGGRALLIPGPFDPDTFNRVTLVAQLSGADIASFQFRRNGKDVLRLNGRQLLHTTERHEIDVEGIRDHHEAFDELLIVFAAAASQIAIEAIEFYDCPASTWLPDEGELGWVAIGTDARRAWTAMGGGPLRLVHSGADASGLELAFATPEFVRGAEGMVRVRIESEQHDEVRELATKNLGGVWKPLALDWTMRAGEAISIHIEIEGAVGVAVGVPRFVQRKEQPKTVLFVTSDTHRADYLGVARSGIAIETPTLDALAARGLMFEDAISISNVTVPSHVSMMTALSPHVTRVVGNLDGLSEDGTSLAEQYRDAGYTCIASTSTVILDPVTSGLGQGFERFSSPKTGQRDSRQTIAQLVKWLPDCEGNDLFVWLHTYDAHSSYEPPKKHRRYYPEGRDPRDTKLPQLAEHERAYWMPDVRDHAYVESLYRSEISYLDSRLGSVLERPRFANAIVAVTADHGESLGNHDVWYAHHLLYPDTLNVPLILAWPDAPAGTRVSAPVRNIDIACTLLELSGIANEEFPGRSLLRFTDASNVPEETPRFAIADDASSASIHSQGWFLVLHLRDQMNRPGSSRRGRHQVELYHLPSDPSCSEDRVETEAERARRMRSALLQFLASGGDGLARARQVDERLAIEVQGLGYAGGEGVGDEAWLDPACSCDWCERTR